MINLTGFQVNKLTIKPGLVVEIAILTVHKSINTGHTLSNTMCVDCDCDIQICESDFQRTMNQPALIYDNQTTNRSGPINNMIMEWIQVFQ